ncbi:MAG: lysophospholipase [Spirochaetaceae bacterium]|jgi:alpha-beta hydrolase superfamily lysophospholipase|nr:lysophospholipase [Spirochaetaceae bacterium]
MGGLYKRKKTGSVKKAGEPPKASESIGEWLSSFDGVKRFVRHWIPHLFLRDAPDKKPRGAVHIVHGMAEHSLRYELLARRLCREGIEVWAPDQRGHGKTADPLINDRGLGGLLGHCADRDGIGKLVSDIHLVNTMIGETYPDVPLFLLGHSWGSFLAQYYIESSDYPLSGCILSGTRGPDGFKIRASVPLMTFIAFLKGVRRGSYIARALADGPFNRPFKPNRTSFDWISRDEREVDAYLADPLSGRFCSAGFYRDMGVLLNKIHTVESMRMINPELPLYVFGGSADPVGDMGESPTTLVNTYRSLGIKDLEFALYPDARHETLHETNREEVIDNLLDWILRHCEKAAHPAPETPEAPETAAEKTEKTEKTESRKQEDNTGG